MKILLRHFALTILAIFSTTLCLSAAEVEKKSGKPGIVSYYNEIRPIFQAQCHGCHQGAKQSGQYVMTEFKRLFQGGESEEVAIVPGNPDDSSLIAQIQVEDGEALMPKNKKPLSSADIELIRNWIAQGAKDDTPPSARQKYDMEHPPQYNLPPVITSVDISPDGKLLAVSGYHEVLIHKTDEPGNHGLGVVARLVGLSERIESAVFSPNGKLLAVTGGSPGRMGELQIWNVAEKELVLSTPVTFDTVYGAAWSPDDKIVSFGCSDNTVRAIEIESGRQVLYNGAHNDWVLDTTFSTKGTHVITVSRDRSMKLVELKTERFIDNITSITPGALKGGLNAVQCHPEKDELLVAGSDGVPRLYKMIRTKDRRIGDDYNLIRAFPAMQGRIFDVRFSKDGKRVAACSSYNGTGKVNVYNTEDAKLVASMEGQQGAVYSVSFSPDGKVIASGGFDGVIRFNNVENGKLLKQFIPVKVQQKKVAAIGN